MNLRQDLFRFIGIALFASVFLLFLMKLTVVFRRTDVTANAQRKNSLHEKWRFLYISVFKCIEFVGFYTKHTIFV
ncbi:MAG: hypothetical protein CVT98_01575 [Bacteroidetes bacterium HGW-Bacteroidetes-15]|nr:MAG: hypothetical protein CVT98_01575 [Bacteroidetes bacterium HGW-Bacteroidetes-15]